MRSPAWVERWSTWSLMRPLAWPIAPRALSWATWAFSLTWSLTWSVVDPSVVVPSVSYAGSVPYTGSVP